VKLLPNVTPRLQPATDEGGVLTSPPSEQRTFPNLLARAGLLILQSRPALLIVLILALGAFVYFINGPAFLSAANLSAVATNASSTAILAVGMMVLMISGVFDLSIGGALVLAGVISAVAANQGVPVPLAWLVAVGVGLLCGVLNGFVVTRVRLNALITTLGTAAIFTGIAQLISQTGVTWIVPGYQTLGQDQLLNLQLPVWISLACVIIFTILVRYNRWFRHLFAVGGNESAARLCGISTRKVRFAAFVLMGALVGVTGVLTASRMASAELSAGENVPLNVITATVLGGAALTGGAGSIPGAALAVFFIALVQDALIILNIGVFWQQIIVGAILLLAVSSEFLTRRREPS
jgi:ribose/xylose/arabinose/galactoside ABC-type transport system permease subunit